MARYGHSMDAYIWRAELGIPNPETSTARQFFEVVYENGARSDRLFSLDSAVGVAMEFARAGEDVFIEDEKEYKVWSITEGIIT